VHLSTRTLYTSIRLRLEQAFFEELSESPDPSSPASPGVDEYGEEMRLVFAEQFKSAAAQRQIAQVIFPMGRSRFERLECIHCGKHRREQTGKRLFSTRADASHPTPLLDTFGVCLIEDHCVVARCQIGWDIPHKRTA